MTMNRWRPDSAARSSTGAAHRDFFVDVGETAGGLVIRAYLPGAAAEAIQATVQNRMLRIRANCAPFESAEVHAWYIRECHSGPMERTIGLPYRVDADAAEASCENGVLTLKLPKVQADQSRRIPIGRQESDQPAGNEIGREDVVTLQSDMSFPASDPPSWTPETSVGS